jgi:hypothetical protein
MSPLQKANSKQAEQEASEGKLWRPGQRLIGANILLPNSRAVGDWRMMYDHKDADSLFTSLPLLRILLPLPF